MPQQRKQMTQTIFSTGFPLSFIFLSQTRSPQGKLPAPVANTKRRLCWGPEPHGARHHPSRIGRWFPFPCALKLLCSAAFTLHQHCFPQTTLQRPHHIQRCSSLTPAGQKSQNLSIFWNKYSPSFHVWTHRKGKWLTRSYRASQSQQPESPGNSFLIYRLQSVPERDSTGRSVWWGWQGKI